MAERRDPAPFDQTADLYAQVRPGYPEELIDWVVERAGLTPDARLLELGCGPGLATQPFARRGYQVVALDQSERMLDRARERLAGLANVTFVRSLFQDWPGEPGAFDLVYAGMAWHWLLQGERDRRVDEWLAPQGTLAVLTNWVLAPWEAGQDLYAAHWPDRVVSHRVSIEERIERVRSEFAEAGVFRIADVGRWPWTARHDADDYVNVLNTYSDHVTLPPDTRRRFLAAVRERIAELGGIVERGYESVAIIARRA